jgi:hypothetical protein
MKQAARRALLAISLPEDGCDTFLWNIRWLTGLHDLISQMIELSGSYSCFHVQPSLNRMLNNTSNHYELSYICKWCSCTLPYQYASHISKCRLSRAVAQVVSHWLLTTVARVRIRAEHVGFVVDKAALGQVFSEYFHLPCQSSFHQLLHHHNHQGLAQ